jgi:septum formation protein
VHLYLASTSPARLATLRAVGVEPFVLPSNVDEEGAVEREKPATARDMVLLLARLKAEAVLGSGIDGFVLGGDSAFELDGITYGKPHLPEVARDRWRRQRGRTGVLHSGHWLIDHRTGAARGARSGVVSTEVTFADNISDDEIDAYVATGEPLHVAGAFTIDGLGAPFITAVTGDPHAVVGLSVALLRQLLLEFDAPWPSFWNRAL